MRTTARPGGLEPRVALAQPVPASARTTATTVTATRAPAGNRMIVSRGSSAPTVNASHRRPGGVPRVGQVVRVDAQLGLGVGAERVVRGELRGDLGASSSLSPLST